jgi:hypothetical protein
MNNNAQLKEVFSAMDKLLLNRSIEQPSEKRLRWRDNLLSYDEVEYILNNWEWRI